MTPAVAAHGASDRSDAISGSVLMGFVGPVKRSITIAGHATSISLEPVFWAALERAAVARGLPLSALVAEVDGARVGQGVAPNLASCLRSWLLGEVGSLRDGPSRE